MSKRFGAISEPIDLILNLQGEEVKESVVNFL